jgi:four helix bundle protein
METKSYKDLIVWQKAIELTIEIYSITKKFPKEEVYGLTSQIRRAAVSISSNIAEGSKRSSRKDFCNFLYNAYGSGAEIESQIIISKRLNYFSTDDCKKADGLLEEIMRMLNSLINKLEK